MPRFSPGFECKSSVVPSDFDRRLPDYRLIQTALLGEPYCTLLFVSVCLSVTVLDENRCVCRVRLVVVAANLFASPAQRTINSRASWGGPRTSPRTGMPPCAPSPIRWVLLMTLGRDLVGCFDIWYFRHVLRTYIEQSCMLTL